MAVKHFKPTSASRRFMTVSDFAEITRMEPERSLVEPLSSKGGRGNTGRITVRHQGNGHKRKYRRIDARLYHGGKDRPVAGDRSRCGKQCVDLTQTLEVDR